MTIERDRDLFDNFDKEGTVTAVTRWISTHDEGIAEWLKNTRRAYQIDRANVAEIDRVALILLKDYDSSGPARIGVLDVGGATIEDIERWRVWQDLQASSRGSSLAEEETQGNGGKAYMFKMFRGLARILGIANRTRNCMGFYGSPMEPVERGNSGFVPSIAEGREVHEVDWKTELQRALQPYKLGIEDLPNELKRALERRQSFTLVEGEEPEGLYHGRIDAPSLLQKVVRHDQSTLAVEQMRIYAIHNGITQNNGKPLALESIRPYPGLEGPYIHEIPDELLDEDGVLQSSTQGGTKSLGRLILWTSEHNMPVHRKKLKPRWKLSYRAGHQMLGSKSVSEIVPATPGADFIYGQVELDTLAAYAAHGRTRPKDGPLVQAVDIFAAERIRELAKQINDRRRHEQDAGELDDVHKENKLLNKFKNRFMPTEGFGGNGSHGTEGSGPDSQGGGGGGRPDGDIPSIIEIGWPEERILQVGLGVPVRLATILKIHVRDEQGRIVPGINLEWIASNEQIARVDKSGVLKGRHGGTCSISARVSGTNIYSPKVTVQVWVVDHVLLTPRSLQIALGQKEVITAEVTNEQGERATDVLLEWEHDADDPLIVRISPVGQVFGNRVGRTSISAGALGIGGERIWARGRVDVEVKPNPEVPKQGSGFPQLLLTDRDPDPLTGEIRRGSPDQPTLWQEVADVISNIWWLNLQSEDAAFAFEKKPSDPIFWRMFHAQQVVEMVIQVHMQQEFTSRGEDEKPDLWLIHKQAWDINQVSLKQAMWKELKQYVDTGRVIE
jgi:hypothetical protein